MSPFWLILIIPASALIGYITCGYLASNTQADQCMKCKIKDKET